MEKCPICGRVSNSNGELCIYHQEAKKNLEENYMRWKTALEVSWKEYLDRVLELDETGVWVKEVIDFLKTGDEASKL